MTAVLLIFVVLETTAGAWRLLDPPLHTTVEAMGALAAMVTASFLFLPRRSGPYGGKLFLLAMGLLGTGLLDVFHAVTVPGRGFVLLDSVATLVGGSYFALIWIPWCASDADAAWKRWMPWAIAIGSTLFGIWTLVALETLPVMTRDAAFTPAAMAINGLAGVLFVGAAARLLLDFHRLHRPEIFLFACMAALFGLAGLMFPFSAPWDNTWWFWHLLRLTAYLLALAFVVREHGRMAASLRVTLTEQLRAKEDILRHSRELSALYTIRRAVAQYLDLEEVLRSGIEATLEALGIDAGGIFLLEPDGQTLTLHVPRGLSDEFVRGTMRIRIGEGISGRAASERRPVVLNVPEYPSERLSPLIVGEGFQTLASAPLLSGGDLVGALNLATRRTRTFSQDELELLAGIGELLGGAAQNARLYERVRHELAERRQAEGALRETRDYLDNLLNYANAPIIVWAPGRTISRFNHAFERLTGHTAEEVVGRDLSVLFPEPSREESLRQIARAASGEYWESVEVPILRKDGEVRVALWNSANIYGEDGVTLAATIAQGVDITGRKRVEERLSQLVEELQRSNAELERFSYVASHDLQEPLRMVASYTQLLARRYRGRLDADADDFIGYAVDGATRMQQMINDLLAYSRVNTRGKPFEPTDTAVALRQALANLEVAVRESHAVVTHDSLPTVMADASQLLSLFQNLVGNAVKFRGEEPPRIHVSAGRRADPAAPKGAEWVFAVADNGAGIDPDYHERIFVVFQRLQTRQEHPAGTGIGLSICKRIVERHGGRMWVESEVGKGATFYFTIPIT